MRLKIQRTRTLKIHNTQKKIHVKGIKNLEESPSSREGIYINKKIISITQTKLNV